MSKILGTLASIFAYCIVFCSLLSREKCTCLIIAVLGILRKQRVHLFKILAPPFNSALLKDRSHGNNVGEIDHEREVSALKFTLWKCR